MTKNIIFGPPGTGKTTELISLLKRELLKHAPNKIAYCSYTREGSYQGRDRALSAFPHYSVDDFPFFRTLHSLAFRDNGNSRGDVISKEDYREFSEKMGMRFTGYYTEDLKNDDDLYLFFDELYRNNPACAQSYLPYLDSVKLKHVRTNYAEYKKQKGILDFTDMIEIFIEKNKALPVEVAFIDEAQDLTTLQWKMIFTAFRDCETLYIAGDDDQAIYQWSGADVDFFLNLKGNAKVLTHSYRLPEEILNFSKRISGQIQKRVDKSFDGTDKKGAIDTIGSLDEITIKPDETYLFLSRNNWYLNGVETWLQKNACYYSRKGKVSIKKEEIDAVNLYEKIRKEKKKSDEDFLKLRRHLTRNKIDYGVPWFDAFDWKENKKMYVRDLIKQKTDLSNKNIRVETIHTAKGDEADNVILLTDITKRVKENLNDNPDSEHRCFYVGATRAKKNLFLYNGESRYNYCFYG
jgi:DNA helicase-2/ATP-dependent DNA helicase PcrA